MKQDWRNFYALTLLIGAGLASACQPSTTNGNFNSGNLANANLTTTTNTFASGGGNANFETTNSNMSASSATIDTKEPERYQATVTAKFQTSGAQNIPAPNLKAEVARNGTDRRMEFALPNGEKIVYLDRADKQFIISPNRKQYAELNKDSLGFDVRRVLLPEQIVNQLKNLKGIERVGEEQMDGRTVVKYRYGATTNTQTQAGNVNTESFILVDKETNLPLRSVINAQSQNGSVQGVQGLNVVTEMSNIKTDVDPNLFAEPTDYAKVAPEVIKQQVNALFSVAMAFVGQMMKSAQQPNASPMTTATPMQ